MKIGIIIPSTSHGRDWKSYKESYLYEHTLKTFLSTYSPEHESIFYIGIDKGDRIYDDETVKNEISRFMSVMKNVTLKFIYMDGIKKGHLTAMWNRLAREAHNDQCVFMFQCGDDIEFKTKGWVNDCIAVLKKTNGIGLVGPINNNPRILTQAFVSCRHYEIFGYFFPEEIINWFCDDWINLLYQGINHFFPLKQHTCINVGGKPRYAINHDPTFINDQTLPTWNKKKYFEQYNQLGDECSKLVKRDLNIFLKKKKK